MEIHYGGHIVIVYQCEISMTKSVCAHLLNSEEINLQHPTAYPMRGKAMNSGLIMGLLIGPRCSATCHPWKRFRRTIVA
jgi:hypothetical protein